NFGRARALVLKYCVVPNLSMTLSSDFDNDGDADGADFLLWQRGQGIATGATKAQGDANGDGAVNAADLAIWKQEIRGASGAGNLVPGFIHYAASGPVAGV